MTDRKIYVALSDVMKLIAMEVEAAVYLIEFKKDQEMSETVEWFTSTFELMGGYFSNILTPEGILNFSGECDFRYAEDYSKNFGFGSPIGRSGLLYEASDHDKSTQIESYLIQYDENNREIGREKISDLGQQTTCLIASLLGTPIIGHALDKKLVGILFEESYIDHPNVKALFRYFSYIRKKQGLEEMRIFLLVISERIGRNAIYYDDVLQRVGIVKNSSFMNVNPYNACCRRIETISGGIRKGLPFVMFLGAGASGSLPMGDELMKIAIINVIQKKELESETLETLIGEFKKWLHESRRLIFEQEENLENVIVTLERVLREEFYHVPTSRSGTLDYLLKASNEAKPPIGYSHIRRMIENGYRPILVTTNYDLLFNKILAENAEILCTDDDFSSKENVIISYIKGETEKIPLIKIHGCLTERKTIEDSVNNTYNFQEGLHHLMHSIYAGDINNEFDKQELQTFFVGYSFRDRDVWNFYSNPEISRNMRMYIVNPSPSFNILNFYIENNKRESEYMSALISIPFSNFTQILLDQMSV